MKSVFPKWEENRLYCVLRRTILMKHGTLALLVCFLALLVTVIAGIADDKHPTEAPSGFTTPSFDGQNSVSNGIAEPAGDSFA
jgi:hypothetical protein